MKKGICLTASIFGILLMAPICRADANTDFGNLLKQHMSRTYVTNKVGVIPITSRTTGEWANVYMLTATAPRAGTYSVSVAGRWGSSITNKFATGRQKISLHLSTASKGGTLGSFFESHEYNFLWSDLYSDPFVIHYTFEPFNVEQIFKVTAPGKYKFYLIGSNHLINPDLIGDVSVLIDKFEAVFMSDMISIKK